MATPKEVIAGYLDRMSNPLITKDEFDDLAERIRTLKTLDLES